MKNNAIVRGTHQNVKSSAPKSLVVKSGVRAGRIRVWP